MSYCKTCKGKRVTYWRTNKKGQRRRVTRKEAERAMGGEIPECGIPSRGKVRKPRGTRKVPRRALPLKLHLRDLPPELIEIIGEGLTWEEKARLGLTSKHLETIFPPKSMKRKKKAKEGIQIYLIESTEYAEGGGHSKKYHIAFREKRGVREYLSEKLESELMESEVDHLLQDPAAVLRKKELHNRVIIVTTYRVSTIRLW